MNSTSNSQLKKRIIIAMVTFFSVTAARAADIATTLHLNPDLSREANPLVSVLGFDAGQLVVANSIAVLVFGICPLLIYVVFGPARFDGQVDSIPQYISIQLFRSKLSRSQFLRGVFLGCPLPKNWLQTTRMIGFAYSWTLVFGSLQATFAWWATHHWGMEWYRQYRGIINFHNYPVIELISLVPVFYILCYLFFRHEFNGYVLRSSKAEESPSSSSDASGSGCACSPFRENTSNHEY